jgi:hypothetical protein
VCFFNCPIWSPWCPAHPTAGGEKTGLASKTFSKRQKNEFFELEFFFIYGGSRKKSMQKLSLNSR